MRTLIAPKQVWCSKTNGRLFIVESQYPLEQWKVRRADGATDVLSEVDIYRNFTPFDPSGLTANDKDGNPVTFTPGPNAPKWSTDA